MLVHNVFLFILLVFKWALECRDHCCYIKLFVLCMCGHPRAKETQITVKILCFLHYCPACCPDLCQAKGTVCVTPLKTLFPCAFFVFHSIVWRMCFVHSPYSTLAAVTYWWKAVSAWDKKISGLLKNPFNCTSVMTFGAYRLLLSVKL